MYSDCTNFSTIALMKQTGIHSDLYHVEMLSMVTHKSRKPVNRVFGHNVKWAHNLKNFVMESKFWLGLD